MNKNIILAGVGGQGILTIAAIIDLAAMGEGLKVKQAEVHGMSQRGGAVQSHLRISDSEIFSDLIPLGKADLILSVEPMESLRYLPYLSSGGTIVTAIQPFDNIANYPNLDNILNTIKNSGRSILIDAVALAGEAGNLKSSNMVLLGAASPYLGIEKEKIEKSIEQLFSRKGQETIDINLRAFKLGLKASENKPVNI
ncbi:MAG: indolepyruvate oxidoreductase subunit beta [Bacteroidales bacterium]|nr:indolepyruvate oxidoreductase subunit beta [Bacteroidales bacterium]